MKQESEISTSGSSQPNAANLDMLMRQRPPFRFIDAVQSWDSSKIICSKTITGEEGFFPGHFPGEPIVPGVILVEMAAQAAQILVSLTGGLSSTGPVMGMLTKIDDFWFYAPVRPGDRLTIAVAFSERQSGFQEGKTVIRSEGRRVAKGKVTVFIPSETQDV